MLLSGATHSQWLVDIGYKDLAPLPWLRIILKFCLSFRAPYGVHWVLHWECTAAPLLPLPDPSSFSPFPSHSFSWWWTQEHSLINLLYTSPHLRVCFLENPTCDSYYSNFEDTGTEHLRWWTNCLNSPPDESWTRTKLRPRELTPWMPECWAAGDGKINMTPTLVHPQRSEQCKHSTTLTCMSTNRGLCVRPENEEERVMSAGCGICIGRALKTFQGDCKKHGTFLLQLDPPLPAGKATQCEHVHKGDSDHRKTVGYTN